VGYYSQVFGRRLSILTVIIVGACMLYPYTSTRSTAIMVPAFFMQFCVQGAWGVIPIHLMELSPPKYSTIIAGTSYQLGNLISSSASTIEAALGENYPLPPTKKGVTRYDYGKVICILMAIVYAYLFVMTFLGPEKRGQEFDDAHDADLGGAAREVLLLENMEKNSTTRDAEKEKVTRA
jgi:MFS transporter, SHS family, lactate transporter